MQSSAKPRHVESHNWGAGGTPMFISGLAHGSAAAAFVMTRFRRETPRTPEAAHVAVAMIAEEQREEASRSKGKVRRSTDSGVVPASSGSGGNAQP